MNANKYNGTLHSKKKNFCKRRKLVFEPQKFTKFSNIRKETPINSLKFRKPPWLTEKNVIKARSFVIVNCGTNTGQRHMLRVNILLLNPAGR